MGGAWSKCFGDGEDEYDVEAGKGGGGRGGGRAIGGAPADPAADEERRAAVVRAAEERERQNATRGTQRTTCVLSNRRRAGDVRDGSCALC